MPRVRSRVGQIGDPGGPLDGKFMWEIEVLLMPTRARAEPESVRVIHSHELAVPRVFDTEEAARKDSRAEVFELCAIINKAFGGDGEEGVLDIQDGLKHKTAKDFGL